MNKDSFYKLIWLLGVVIFAYLAYGINVYLADKNEIVAEAERSKCLRELEVAKIERVGINDVVWTNTCIEIRDYKIKTRKTSSYLK